MSQQEQGLEGRVSNVEDNVEQLKETVKKQGEKLDNVEKEMQKLQSQIDSKKEKVYIERVPVPVPVQHHENAQYPPIALQDVHNLSDMKHHMQEMDRYIEDAKKNIMKKVKSLEEKVESLQQSLESQENIDDLRRLVESLEIEITSLKELHTETEEMSVLIDCIIDQLPQNQINLIMSNFRNRMALINQNRDAPLNDLRQL